MNSRIKLLTKNKLKIEKILDIKNYTDYNTIYKADNAGVFNPLITNNTQTQNVKARLMNSLQNNINIPYSRNQAASLYQYSKINKIEFQFEKGFIEAIKVWLNLGSSEFIFENIYAVGFSSVSNYKFLADTKLFIRNGFQDGENYFIYVSDIIRNYGNVLDNYTRDYSPADTTFVVDPSEFPEVSVRKEKYINLIDAKFYTDLTGIDKTKPNGIIQIELSKRFNINTARTQAGKTRSDFGYFNYLELFGALSKIEQNNKELVLHNAGKMSNGILISPNYGTTLDFLRYENYNIGVNVGLILFDRPDKKFTAYVDFGIKYGHTLIADSILIGSTNNFLKKFDRSLEAHTVTFQFPKISIDLFPESRITPKISWQLNSTKLFSNNQFKQIVSYEKTELSNFLVEKNARFSNQYEIFVRVAPNKDQSSHIFVRWRFFTQFSDANTSFSQFQIGYAYNWTLKK